MANPAFMQRALDLAEATAGLASPNPQVGCVIVRDSVVLGEGAHLLGEGAHLYDQRDHAEIVALQQAAAASHDVHGATAYVTLEPCSHHGRTGPCADALIAAGITHCFVATVDPNPQVSGAGIARLRAAGVAVHVGLEQAPARALNDAFAFSITHDRPFVTLKSALSLDGRLAPTADCTTTIARVARQPFWLTGPQARAEVHRLRHGVDAVLTGIGTVLADNPLLTDRSGLPRRRPLLRVILDSDLRLPLTSNLITSAQKDLWIFCGRQQSPTRIAELEAAGARVTQLSALGPPDLGLVLQHLHAAKLRSVLVEVGMTLNAAFLRAALVDRAVLFYAPIELGPASLPFAANGPTSFALEQQMLSVDKRSFGPDVCVAGLLHDPWVSTAGII